MAEDKPNRKQLTYGITGRRTYQYRDTDIFIDEKPYFLDELPQWHQDYFSDTDKIYQPEAEEILIDTFKAIKHVSRIMSIYEVCLLLFPHPSGWIRANA